MFTKFIVKIYIDGFTYLTPTSPPPRPFKNPCVELFYDFKPQSKIKTNEYLKYYTSYTS